ncbi:L,D-transpeptidase [Bacillus sp. FJAT-25509]|uniref:L,D-transpeptidase n=1 Tax=Bacillaceae TaxID=186817 RepID=UPI0006F9AEEE|nr:L,D-transpeptidase [Bacillus sp. FJAT-25509]KQL33919.1 L,D-transpeptidase [Bacillus sp. FJAT-25509]
MLYLLKLVLSLLLVIGPVWPLGQNPRVGEPFIIINKEVNNLAYIEDGKVLRIYRIATGKTADLTPEGIFNITYKAKNPYWRKKNIPGGDPKNPLGTRWIGFDALGTDGSIYGIHGNNDPSTIGKYISNGCVRMYTNDVNELFDKIPYGTKVLITTSTNSFEQLAREQGAIR